MLDQQVETPVLPEVGGHELERLSQVHLRMVELALAGMSTKDIAEVTGRTPQCISMVLRSPLFQQELSKRREMQIEKIDQTVGSTIAAARAKIEGAAERAADTEIELLGAPDHSVRRQAAQYILDKALGTSREPTGATIIIQGDNLNLLNLALSESDHMKGTSVLKEKVVDAIPSPAT